MLHEKNLSYQSTRNKILVLKIKKICHYFSKDFTASETSNKLAISRQTVNSYYKLIRDSLNYESFVLDENIFCIEYIKIQNNYFFYINKNSYIYLLENESKVLTESIKRNLINSSKNGVRIVFNRYTKKFTTLAFYTSNNELQKFVDERLKKFRGIKKENLKNHIKESIFRYNYPLEELNKKILNHLCL